MARALIKLGIPLYYTAVELINLIAWGGMGFMSFLVPDCIVNANSFSLMLHVLPEKAWGILFFLGFIINANCFFFKFNPIRPWVMLFNMLGWTWLCYQASIAQSIVAVPMLAIVIGSWVTFSDLLGRFRA